MKGLINKTSIKIYSLYPGYKLVLERIIPNKPVRSKYIKEPTHE